MGLLDIFKSDETFIAIDIGSSAVKLIELDLSDDRPRLINLGLSPLSGDIFSNNVISKPDKVAEAIGSLLEANAIGDRRVVTAVPGPSVFTKKIKMPRGDLAELASNIQFEAANFIPHNIDAVRLDYHVIGEVENGQLEVLVVAVKNEIIDSFTECLALSGLETAIVDVDFFALQNTFEMCYPELLMKTVAIINLGARYTSINICRGGNSLFTGDIGVGGRALTDDLMQQLQVDFAQAEQMKKAASKSDTSVNADQVKELIEKNIEYVASEFNRQLSFFWNASGADEGIDKIMLAGGGAQLPGLVGELSEKTGIECALLNPMKEVDCGESFEPDYLAEVSPFLSIAVGLGIREIGDKIMPELD